MKIIIIGGGIVGLAAAVRLDERFPGVSIVLVEKEGRLAAHQTGRNSGVLHSGIYYRPGSIRASICREGKMAMERFCEREGIPFARCGKVIAATRPDELPSLERIFERGQANGVDCRRISREELRELEPHCAGIQGLHVPETGIVDYTAICGRLAGILTGRGHDIRLNTRVTGLEETDRELVVETNQGALPADFAVNCTGLHADRTAALAGAHLEMRIIPFRGEYFELKPAADHLCRGLIYPVPDARFPFLGVHFTRMIGGGVECGPNAVLALAREGYGKLDVDLRDLWDALSYAGFRRLAARYWRMGLEEMFRSASKRAFVRGLRRLVPEIREEDLVAAPSGIRAQAVSLDGTLIDDFAFHESRRMVHVINAASPAATASLSIGHLIVDRLAAHF